MNVELPFIKDMFESIAPRYDLLNRVLSGGQDIAWRRKLVALMDVPEDAVVLDVACGTADVSMEIARQKGPGVKIFGIDFSKKMLAVGKTKTAETAWGKQIHLIAGNAFHLPFEDGVFDAATIAFGIRNIKDKIAAMKAFRDGLKPGGMLIVLELATPEKGLLLSLYLFYFKKILPLIGKFVSGNSMAYQYLPESVGSFPQAREFAAMMASAGFSDVTWKKLTGGIAVLFVGIKPFRKV